MKAKTQKVSISKLKANKENPRYIKDHKFEKLKQSLIDFPQMLELRPIVVDSDFRILGGNMRYKAAQDIGLKEVFITVAEGLTDEQKNEFIIKDNASFGDWDWDLLANNWSDIELGDWGVDVWKSDEIEYEDPNYSEKNKEYSDDDFEDKTVLKLEFDLDTYQQVKTELYKHGKTPEAALCNLLNIETIF